MSESYDLGLEGEAYAKQYFIKKGFQILAERWRFGKAELDLIVQKDKSLHIVEVKTRSDDAVQNPEEAVGFKKQKMMIEAANEFVVSHQLDVEVQFDIMSLVLRKGEWKMNYIPDAFRPSF